MTTASDLSGRCAVCGHEGEYLVLERPLRENYHCRSCRASMRYRHQAGVLVALYGPRCGSLRQLVRTREFGGLVIFEPGVSGPLRRHLRRLDGYVNSYFWPGVTPGDVHDGVRCEDLHRLTFDDCSIDLVISSDILEHVRRPAEAFAELYRVLRPGGRHVFTVPFRWPIPSTSTRRVDTSGDEDVMLLPARYHGSPVDPQGSLVYTDFGIDLPEQLRAAGFDVAVHHGGRQNLTIVAERPR